MVGFRTRWWSTRFVCSSAPLEHMESLTDIACTCHILGRSVRFAQLRAVLHVEANVIFKLYAEILKRLAIAQRVPLQHLQVQIRNNSFLRRTLMQTFDIALSADVGTFLENQL